MCHDSDSCCIGGYHSLAGCTRNCQQLSMCSAMMFQASQLTQGSGGAAGPRYSSASGWPAYQWHFWLGRGGRCQRAEWHWQQATRARAWNKGRRHAGSNGVQGSTRPAMDRASGGV